MTGQARRRLVRGAAVIAVAAAMLLLALAAAAPLLVDRDALARRVAAELSLALGLPVQLDAISGLALLPVPHTVLGPLRVMPPDDGGDGAAVRPLAEARSLRLELAWPALLLGQAEPVLLRAEGLDVDWTPRAALPPPRWLAALSLPASRVRDAELTLDYPPGARRLRWPLRAPSVDGTAMRPPSLAPPGPRPGRVRLTAALPLEGTRARLSGSLELHAEADLAELPALTIAPLELTGSGLDVGELRNLSLDLGVEQARRSAEGRWRLQGLSLSAGALRIDGDMALSVAADGRLAGQGRLRLAPLDLRNWLATHGAPPLPGQPQTLRCVAVDGQFQLAAGRLGIAPAALRIDTSQAAFAATVDLDPRLPTAAVAARLDKLDIDPYLVHAPITEPVSGEPRAGPAPLPAPCPELPDAAPTPPPAPAAVADDTELHLELAAERLRAGRLAYGNLTAVATQQGPLTAADIDAAAFYGGTLGAHVEHQLQPDAPPRQTLRGEVKNADLGALLADLQGSPQVTGTADLTADLAATGADQAAIRRALSGTVQIDLRDGQLAALDQAAANLGPLLSAIGLPVTPDAFAFSRLEAGAEGTAGVFNVVHLDGQSPLFRLGGGGRIDTGDETLDLALTATLTQPQDGPDLEDLAGIEVPIRVAGSIAAPAVQADLAPAIAEAARRTARRHLNKDGNVLQQLEKATGVKGLEQGLRGLFGF